jgi:hypothetical protein
VSRRTASTLSRLGLKPRILGFDRVSAMSLRGVKGVSLSIECVDICHGHFWPYGTACPGWPRLVGRSRSRQAHPSAPWPAGIGLAPTRPMVGIDKSRNAVAGSARCGVESRPQPRSSIFNSIGDLPHGSPSVGIGPRGGDRLAPHRPPLSAETTLARGMSLITKARPILGPQYSVTSSFDFDKVFLAGVGPRTSRQTVSPYFIE